jgi:two-component system, OmpR family, phosphate regulon sensor histidine kinase PhoR
VSNKAYKTIVVLLASALLAFFAIQGLWIRNSYSVAAEEFSRAANEALAETGKKLQLRYQLSKIKQENLVFEKETSVHGSKTRIKIVVNANGGDSTIKTVITDNKIIAGKFPDTPPVPEVPRVPGEIIDSVVRNFHGAKTFIVRRSTVPPVPQPGEDVNELVKKMMYEVRSFDTSPLEKMKADTLKKLIGDQLKRKGIEADFEFAVVKGNKPDSLVLSSAAFSKFAGNHLFTSVLFPENILKKNDILKIYFHSENAIVFARLKSLLLLSGVFAVFILGIFIFTLRLILKQKKLTEMKNDFINNMTHELKTPIATISVAADALKNEKVRADAEKMDYYSSVIREENNKMNRNVEKVLQLAMTDKNDFLPELVSTDFHALIGKCLGNFRILFAEKNIQCVVEKSAANYTIYGDPFHLENMINNLVDNSAKYSSAAPVIKLRTENLDGKFIFTIADNGIGMSASLQKKIFEKFYRAQTGNIHDVKGFGIGLSYVNNIVQAHKGQISVSAEEGKGSIFKIELPLA